MTKPNTHILAVCSRNKQRSLTAELVFAHHPNITVRSAGTSPSARHVVTISDIHWADHILCMEKKHQQLLELRFGKENLPPVTVANIEDNYEVMDAELVTILIDEICNLT